MELRNTSSVREESDGSPIRVFIDCMDITPKAECLNFIAIAIKHVVFNEYCERHKN